MVDLTKPVQTRDGRKARVLCTDRKHNISAPVIALLTEENGNEFCRTYRADGQYMPCRSASDLVNLPEKRMIWVNVYVGDYLTPHSSKELADMAAAVSRIACVEVQYEVSTC